MDSDRSDLAPSGRLTRRGFLGAAGSAALLGGPLAGSALAGSAVADAPASRPSSRALKGLVGATVLAQSGNNQVKEATVFDKVLGNGNPSTYPLARSVQKMYFKPGVFPDAPSSTVLELGAAGCRFILCYKPSFASGFPDFKALRTSVKAMSAHGVKGRVVLWQEPQDKQNHLSAARFRALVAAYYEAVHPYYELDYNGSFVQGPAATVDYCPDAKYISRIAVDFYGNDYYTAKFTPPNRLTDLENHADATGKPFGIYEFGVTDYAPNAPTQAKALDFFDYLYAAMINRVKRGKQNADILWYDAGNFDDPSTHRYLRPMLRQFYTNLSSAA